MLSQFPRIDRVNFQFFHQDGGSSDRKKRVRDTPALERLIGPVAYRGRQAMVQKKTTSLNRSTSIGPSRTPVSELNLSNRNVPTHTIASERSTYSGPRRPGQR